MFKKWLICLFLIIYSFAFGYSEQVVVSQFSTELARSTSKNTYSLTGISNSENIRAVASTDLSETLNFSKSITGVFTGIASNLKFDYDTAEKSIAIPVTRNTSSSVVTGKFQLSEKTTSSSNEDVINYLIEETIKLPAKVISLTQATVDTGVKFTYNEGSAKAQHLSAYKKQEYVIRITRGTDNTDYDVIDKKNGFQFATGNNGVETYAKSFMEGTEKYVDFLVTADKYDKAQNVQTDAGLSLKFMPEDIEIFGLPKGSYRIEVYSFRYSKEVTTSGNVVITKEDSKTFTVGNTEFLQEGIDIMSFSSSDFPIIKATVLTIGTTTSPAITVSEDGKSYGGATITATSGSIYTESSSSGAITVNIGGTSDGNGNYYQLWEVVYTTTNTTIDTLSRTVTYKKGSNSASTTYNVISSTAQFTGETYQTVFATFTDKTYGNGVYEINDRTMNKYSNGYRNIRKVDSSGITALYKGISGGENMTSSSYNWLGSSAKNSLIISKAISDSKGTFQEVGNTSNNFTFYTTVWEPNLTYVNESEKTNQDDTVTLTWDSPDKSSYETTLNEEKVMFRIIRSTGDSTDSEKYRYKPEANENPIVESDLTRLTNFMNGTNSVNYYDVMFDTDKNSKQTYGNVIFDFSKSNILKIVGLDAGSYKIQIYSLQNEDTSASSDAQYDYRVLTYGGPLKVKNANDEYVEEDFSMMEPEVPSLSYTIDSIDYDSETAEVKIGLIINADQLVSLTKNNLTAKKSEEETSSKYYFSSPSALMVEAWNPDYSKGTTSSEVYNNTEIVDPSVIDVYKSEKDDFQYPLDIVFLIDNSASMQNEIDAVRDGLDNFSKSLTARGYDVKFNLITFGANQTTTQTSYSDGVIGSPINKSYSEYSDIDFSKYTFLAIFNKSQKWFSSTTKLKDALANLQGVGGATGGEENGSYALHYGIEQLKANGRYLNKSYEIVSSSAPASEQYKPSKKWLIFLTDENMDIDYVPSGYSKSKGIVKEFAKQLEDSSINLTGIYHTSFVNSLNTDTTYSTLNPKKSLKEFWSFRGTYFEVNKDTKGYYILYNRVGNKQYLATDTNGVNLVSPSSTLNTTKTYYIKDIDCATAEPAYTGGNQKNPITYYGKRYIYDFFGGNGSRPQDFDDVFYTDFALDSNWSSGKNLFNMYDMGVDGELVKESLIDSISDIGIIQRWIIKYTSPYDKIKGEDGQPRESLFSLSNVKSYESTTSSSVYLDLEPYNITGGTATTSGGVVLGNRNYTVPMSEIKVKCINPSDDNPQLIKKDGKIYLKGSAQSQYKTEIDGVMQWVNYPIIKGTFIITGNYSNGSEVGKAASKIVTNYDKSSDKVTLTKDVIDEKVGYYAESNLNADEFTKLFGKNPKNVVVKFIAETARCSDYDEVEGVKVVEKDQPKVTSLTMTNVTLSDFMGELKKADGTSTFSASTITSATVKTKENTEGLTADDLNVTTTSSGMELNVKDGDKVKLEFTIDDESITSTSTGVKVIYNNSSNPYVATYVGAVANTTKTNWKVELDSFVYKNGIDSISFDITDDSVSPNTTAITADVFNQPEILDNTVLEASLNINKYSDEYYDDGSIRVTKVTNETDEKSGKIALAYLVVFDYDSTIVDDNATTGTYPISGGKKWISYSSNEFNFFEGKYTYNKTVYVMNSAGAIKSITHNSDKDALIINSGSIGNIITRINTNGSNFYVDKQAPSVTDFNFKKDSDPNLSDSSLLNNNSVASGILLGTISNKRLYKEGDGVSVNFNLKEVNFFKTVLSQVSSVNIINNPVVAIAGNSVAVNTTTGLEGTIAAIDNKAYKKSGIAVDLTSGDSAINSNMSLTVYDRAGNKATPTFDSYYDDRIPNGISIASQVTDPDDNTIKFTNNVNFPLNSRSGTNYSVGLLSNLTGSLKHVGDITTSGAINLTSFETNSGVSYNPVLNAVNYPVLRSFSKSGKSGSVVKETVVLDTKINDARSSITETVYTYNSGSYVIDLTNTLKTIGELVGLKSYSISSSSNGAKLQHGITTDNISAVNTLVNLDTESLYRDTIGTTPYTSINNIYSHHQGIQNLN